MNTVIITGGNRGIGLAAARHIADAGHPVILVCRDRERGEEALARIAQPAAPNRHRLVIGDLASLASVREAAARIGELETPVAALINNAAVLPRQRAASPDGFEMQLAVTHLGHFLLTNLLLPMLRRSPRPCRVVTVASAAHLGPAFDFNDPNWERRPYRRVRAYQQSKLANVLFSLELARRVAGTGVEAVVLHPGTYDTGLLRDYMGGGAGAGALARVMGRRDDRGGPVLADLAVGRQDEDLNGAYFNKTSRSSPSSAARDAQAQSRLWTWSAEAVGL
ncbi:MAG: SDR family NAD(P)-dependent oxidoreductase [Gemmatimonadota bacterium]|nr:SDR family NAD(P)-dependent oxidoreductase [Gemmatimonadota bacterium]